MKYKSFSKESGFSLTELIVVLAIIGILSAIAVPTYRDMKRKGDESEAKVHLTGLYSSMKMFYGEWLQYYGDWRNLGFYVDGDMQFRLGFASGAGGGSPVAPANYEGPGQAAGQIATQVNTDHASGFCGPGERCTEMPTRICVIGGGAVPEGCSWSAALRFTACACTLDPNEPPGSKRILWFINEQKQLRVTYW